MSGQQAKSLIIGQTADWHLEASRTRQRMDPTSGLNQRLVDFSNCARFCIEDAVARGAQAVLHAGDIWNSNKPSPTERRMAIWAFRAAVERGIPVIAIKGNHDDPRNPCELNALDTLRGLPGITIVDSPKLLYLQQTPADLLIVKSKLAPDESALLQIACLPYPSKQQLLASTGSGSRNLLEVNQFLREAMMDCARGLAVQLRPEIPSVLLGHFSVDTAAAGKENRLMALGAEFTLNLHELESLGFSAILLGHIHKYQGWYPVGTTTAYCGSPEACNHGEEGEEKGYLLWDFTPGEQAEYQQIQTPYRQFITFDFDGSDRIYGFDETLKDAIVRVRIAASEADNYDVKELEKTLEKCGVFEYKIEVEQAAALHHRHSTVSAAMSLSEALGEWLKLHPDYQPLAEELVSEAVSIEANSTGGAA